MSFLRTVSEDEATGEVAVIYREGHRASRVSAQLLEDVLLHPAAYQAWRGLIASIAKPMDERRMRSPQWGRLADFTIHLLLAGAW